MRRARDFRGRSWRRVSGERGYTLIELLIVTVILLTVMVAITGLYLSGAKAEARSQREFKAQVDARVALGQLRIDAHCAGTTSGNRGVAFGGTAAANGLYPTVVLSETGIGNCPRPGTFVSWCTVQSGGLVSLYRSADASCNSSDRFFATHLTSSGVFGPAASLPSAQQRLHVDFGIDFDAKQAGDSYRLVDDLTLRNSSREL